MTRTTFYKGIYFVIVGGVPCVFLFFTAYFRLPPFVFVAALPLLFVPGRILGYFWRDLLVGLKLLQDKSYLEAEFHSQRFLQDVRRRPWLKHLIWLGSGSYTRDCEVMALNNLGAAQIGLAEFALARASLAHAIALDPRSPHPVFNMGVLETRCGNTTQAESYFKAAKDLGYGRGLTDKIVTASQNRFASLDGRPGLARPIDVSLHADSADDTGETVTVQLLNDASTPMQFVVTLLQDIFGKTRDEAIAVMLAVHRHGEAACGTFTYKDAKTRVAEVTRRAEAEGHTLHCKIRPR